MVVDDHEIHSMQNEDEAVEDGGTDRQTDIHGCLDNVKTHDSAGDHDGTSTLKQPVNFSTHAWVCMRQQISNYL